MYIEYMCAYKIYFIMSFYLQDILLMPPANQEISPKENIVKIGLFSKDGAKSNQHIGILKLRVHCEM